MSERLLALLAILALTPTAAALSIGPIEIDASVPIPAVDAHAGPVSVDGAQLVAPVEQVLGSGAAPPVPASSAIAPPADLATSGSTAGEPSAPMEPTGPSFLADAGSPAPWALALGATLAGLLVLALRGPLARVRSTGVAVAWKVALGLVLVALGLALAFADAFQEVADAWMTFWIAASLVAWLALALGAGAVARTGRVGRAMREEKAEATPAV